MPRPLTAEVVTRNRARTGKELIWLHSSGPNDNEVVWATPCMTRSCERTACAGGQNDFVEYCCSCCVANKTHSVKCDKEWERLKGKVVVKQVCDR